jgi:uncharacterized protein YjiS (DUF1127 family)
MSASSSIEQRLIRYHARFALVEVLIGIIAAGWQAVAGWAKDLVASQHRAWTRRELRRLSDRTLRDIGLERSDIDQLFR